MSDHGSHSTPATTPPATLTGCSLHRYAGTVPEAPCITACTTVMHKHAYRVNKTMTRKAGYRDSSVGGADLDAEERNNNK